MKHSELANKYKVSLVTLLITAAAVFFVYAGILFADPISTVNDSHFTENFITPDTWNDSYSSSIDVQDNHTSPKSIGSTLDIEDDVKDYPVIFYQLFCRDKLNGASYDGGSATAIRSISSTNRTCYASFDYEGLGFAILGTVGPAAGWADVYVDGTKVNSDPVSFRDVATKDGVAVFGKSNSKKRIEKHSVRIVVQQDYDGDSLTSNDKIILDSLQILVSNDRPVGVDRKLSSEAGSLFASGRYLKYPRIDQDRVVYEYHLIGSKFSHSEGAGCSNLADHKVEIFETSLSSGLDHNLDTISQITPSHPDQDHLHQVNRLPVVSPYLTVWQANPTDPPFGNCDSNVNFRNELNDEHTVYDQKIGIQSNISVDGSKLAYQRNDGDANDPDWNIYYSDLATSGSGSDSKVVSKIATADETRPSISGNRVAWVHDNGSSRTIHVKDVKNGNVTSMTTIGCNQLEPAIYKDFVVWQEEDCDEPAHNDPNQTYQEDGKIDNNIIMAQLNSSTTKILKTIVLDDNESNSYHPRISLVAGYIVVVWEDWRNDWDGKWTEGTSINSVNEDNPDIYAASFKKSSGAVERNIQVTQDNVPEINPDISGENVVFEKVDVGWIDYGETTSELDCKTLPVISTDDVINYELTKRCYYPNSIYMKDLVASFVSS